MSAGEGHRFVGRESELEAMMGSLGQAMAHKGGVLLIDGDMGMGKSRLIEEFCELIHQGICLLLIGRCLPGPPTSYLPFQEAFSNNLLVDEHMTAAMDNAHGERLPFQLLEVVRSLSAGRTLVVVLEDLHWADEESVHLLHFLAKNITGSRVLIIGTHVQRGSSEKTGTNGNHLTETLRVMRREGLCDDLHLNPLKNDDMMAIAADMIGGPMEDALASQLIRAAAGNPLFFIEALNCMINTGKLESFEGKWRSKEPGSIPVSSSASELVLNELCGLTRTERKVLECASFMTDHIDEKVISKVQDLEVLTVLEALERIATTTNLLKEDKAGYVFSSPLNREAVLNSLSLLKRNAMSEALGQEMDQRSL